MYFYSKHFIIRIRILTASNTELSILNVDPIVKNVLFQPWCTAITTVHWFIITVILKLGEIYVEFLYCTIFNYWKFLNFCAPVFSTWHISVHMKFCLFYTVFTYNYSWNRYSSHENRPLRDKSTFTVKIIRSCSIVQ